MPQRHIVQPGECLSSIASRYGFASFRAVFDHPDNADLKKKRKNPSILHPGDVVLIPDKAEKSAEIATGALHRFKLKRAKTLVRIALQVNGAFGYEVIIDGVSTSGKTDGASPIERDIDPHAQGGDLYLWPDTEGNDERRDGLQHIPLRFGHLDPVEEASGVQGVLANLGFYFGPIDGQLSDATRAAVWAFQKSAGLTPSGDIDDALRDKLRAAHDG